MIQIKKLTKQSLEPWIVRLIFSSNNVLPQMLKNNETFAYQVLMLARFMF